LFLSTDFFWKINRYIGAYQSCLETVQNFDCHLEKDWQAESEKLQVSNQNITESIKANNEVLKSYSENISKAESNYSSYMSETTPKLDKFKSDVLSIETILAYVKNVHLPESTMLLEKRSSASNSNQDSSSLTKLGSRIYETADYLTHPVGNVLLKFANIFLQTHQEETNAEELPSKPSSNKLTSALAKLENLLSSLKKKIVDQVTELEANLVSAKSDRQTIIDENTALVNDLDILNKRLQSQVNEQQKLYDEYQSNLAMCKDIAFQKDKCEQIKKTGEETQDEYHAASDIISQAEEELIKIIAAINSSQNSSGTTTSS
jgi:predicted DNA-binding protein YlxM (UPF0122 family)